MNGRASYWRDLSNSPLIRQKGDLKTGFPLHRSERWIPDRPTGEFVFEQANGRSALSILSTI
jgi:hypothetical protein